MPEPGRSVPPAPPTDPPAAPPAAPPEGGVPPLVGDPGRLGALAATCLLDTPPEQGFDDVVALAAQICHAPVALVSLVDRDRQWFKARLGFEPPETPLDRSVCAHALALDGPLVVPDLALDPRTRANPLVTGEPFLRFYAGAPLRTREGQALGTLCVLDHRPRPGGLDEAARAGLLALAGQVMTLLELRGAVAARDRLVLEVAGERERLAAMFEATPSFMALLAGPEHRLEVMNPAFRRLAGAGAAIGRTLAEALPELVARGDADGLDRVWASGETAVRREQPLRLRPRPGAPEEELFLDLVCQPLRDEAGRVRGIFLEGVDVTERAKAGRRQEALVRLGERLRDGRGVEAMVRTAAEVMSGALRPSRAGFGTVDAAREAVEMQPGWCAPGVAPVQGTHHFRDYGSYIEDLKRGAAVVIPDVAADPRTRDGAAALLALGIRGLCNLPVLVAGRLVLVVYVHHAEVHAWSEEELAFVRQVGDLVESAIARSRAEAEQRLLNHEISHRLKNTLAMVQAIAAQTLREVEDRAAVEGFDDRLRALASAHDILLRGARGGAGLEAVARAALAPFDGDGRIRVEGPAVPLGSRAALSLSLALHELGTNALKYGALSAPGGRVDLAWELRGGGEPLLVLVWQEGGGPPVAPPRRRGFGTRLIRMGLVGTGGAEVRFNPEGLRVEMSATPTQLREA